MLSGTDFYLGIQFGPMKTKKISPLLLAVLSLITIFSHANDKPKLTLDEFFNYVSYDAVRLSPDGRALVTVVDRPDWDQRLFRTELWLYRDDGRGLIPLTQSGKDSVPRWSPDGEWIAFLSERKAEGGKSDSGDEAKSDGVKGGDMTSFTSSRRMGARPSP